MKKNYNLKNKESALLLENSSRKSRFNRLDSTILKKSITLLTILVTSFTFAQADISWTGVTSSDWNIASNWSSATIPTSADNAIIISTTNLPVINESVSVLDITVAPSAILTIAAEGSLTVANNLVQNGTLTINSDASSTGSLIVNGTSTGTVNYNRYIPTTEWYLVSAPFSNETFQDLIANNSFAIGSTVGFGVTNIGVGLFSNAIGSIWFYAQNTTVDDVTPGDGFSVKLTAADNLAMMGTLNTENVTHSINTGTRNNYNLLGNPYISYVNSTTFTSDNSTMLTSQTVWLWDGTEYVTHNLADPIAIAPGQGFFVEAGSTGTITFNNTNQSHQTSDTFMRETPVTSFQLFLESNGTTKSAKVFYIEGTTTGFDNGYDSKMFGDGDNSLAIFSELVTDNEGQKLAIQTLPSTSKENFVVPVGVHATAGKEISISLNPTNFSTDEKIYLEDKVNNTFTRLDEANSVYTITLTEDLIGAGRFYIHTTQAALSLENNVTTNNVRLYKLNNTTLNITGLPEGISKMALYNILGKQVMNTSFSSNGVQSVDVSKLTSGVYLVQLQTEEGILNKKIVLE